MSNKISEKSAMDKKKAKLKIPRRDFFKIAAASGAGIAVTSCSNDPVEKLLPYIAPPANLTAGKVYKFASTCTECAAACGYHVRSIDGRVIGVEGNPNHPLSKGALCAIGQSGLQQLYNPSRIKKPEFGGLDISWDEALNDLTSALTNAIETGQRVLYIGAAKNSAFNDLVDEFMKAINGKSLLYEANPYNALIKAHETLLGRAEIPFYDFEAAKSVFSFGADFLESWHSVVENSQAYADFHSYEGGKKNFHLHISSHLSLTASNADKWISCKPGGETKFALAVTKYLLPQSNLSKDYKDIIEKKLLNVDLDKILLELDLDKQKFEKLAQAFGTNGTGMAIVGGVSSSNLENSGLHSAVTLLNIVGGAINNTVKFGADYSFSGDSAEDIKNAIIGKDGLSSGAYDVVIINNVNLLNILPSKNLVKDVLIRVPLLVGMFTTHNETSSICKLLLPVATGFESYDAVRPKAGVVSLQQPSMVTVPGYSARGAGDIILNVASSMQIKLGETELSGGNFRDWIANNWLKDYAKISFIDWEKALQIGGIFRANSLYDSAQTNLQSLSSLKLGAEVAESDDLKLVVFNTNLSNINGQSSGRGWLHEIPSPISQVMWDSWAEINPKTAKEYDIRHGDEIEVESKQGKLKLAAYVYHGAHPGVVAIAAGLGSSIMFPNYSSRRNAFLPFTSDSPEELLVHKVGENVLDLLEMQTMSGDFLFSSTVTIKKTGKKSMIATADGQWRDDMRALKSSVPADYGDRSQKGRGLLRFVSFDDIKSGNIEESVHHPHRAYTVKKGTPTDFYFPVEKQVVPDNVLLGFVPNDNVVFHDPYRFEMAIDLDRCTGCSACVVACYAENNIPVVGKERAFLNRQMNWIRVERYFEEDESGDTPRTVFGPSNCQQCGNAGCEPVCPVYATYHNPDGLNAQIYNRCVGTRYCGNNCAYKQRRFNWRSYKFPYPLNLQLNPNVSVRSKGVMEKCTFCVQRIDEAKLNAKQEGRIVQDNEIVTACQSVCPTKAIVFGNGADKNSMVSQKKNNERGYHQLEELNYKPAVTYLRKVVRQDLV